MRELSVELFCSVDGYGYGRSSPAYFGYGGPDLDRWIAERTMAAQVLVMGRWTYQDLAGIVATTEDPSPDVGAEGRFRRMDELPKIVFSGTLGEPLSWVNSTLISEDPAVAVPRLKAAPGDPLRVIGSLSLGCSLVRLGLVDRLTLVVFPLLLGETGEKPILAQVGDQGLRLAATEVLDDRLVCLDYHLEPRE